MAKGTNDVPKLYIEAVQTVSPMTVTDERRARKVLAMDDLLVSGIILKCRLHVLLYYNNASEDDSGWFFAGWSRESLARALSEQQPLLAGRLRRVEDGDGELEIVSNDSGVRLIEARIAMTLSSFLELKGKEREETEAQLVSWTDVAEQNPQFSPLFYIQVTNFQCRGYSIGINCSLLLADLLVVENFLSSWAIIHRNIVSNINGSKKPLFHLPNLKTHLSSPTAIISSIPSKCFGQTLHFRVTAEDATLDRSETFNSLALLCVEESESNLAIRMTSEFYLFVKESFEVIKVEKCANRGLTRQQLSLKSKITCADWDDLGAKEVAFRDGNKPLHVSYWMGSTCPIGVVMAIQSPNEATLGINILVSVPNASEL
ncbi:hypothetical protein I3843_11G066800 [Carya illinoinensis]|nr:hypothetical protein I3843_11G066800 [Carya illinoinensis]